MKCIFTQIGDIAETIPVVAPDAKCDTVNHLFKINPTLEGLAIVGDDGIPSLIMRARFFQRIGTQYGYNLYMGRPVGLVMDAQPLVVDYSEQITEVSVQAMNRSKEELYDLVLVMSKGELVGAVSIQRLLLAVADDRAEVASFMNPLTGLPGNWIIDDRLNQTHQLDSFSVLYIDLDHFKSYNDSYGFKKGDQMLQATANLLRQHFTLPEAFLGHIGGDDFIVMLSHHEYQQVCDDVIAEFEQLKRSYYSEEDMENNYVLGVERSGQRGPIPLVTLSIAVVTNRVLKYDNIDQVVSEATRIKKVCKAVAGNIVCCNEDNTLDMAK